MKTASNDQPSTHWLARPFVGLALFVVCIGLAAVFLPRQQSEYAMLFTVVSISWFGVIVLWEWYQGRYANGRKTSLDWQLFGISLTWITFVERPLIFVAVWGLCYLLIPQHIGAWQYLQQDYFWGLLLAYVLIDELLHGGVHFFAHTRRVKNRWLAKLQSYYKATHRMHHLHGGTDDKGQLSATQTICVSWGWPSSLPNYWFGSFFTYMGLFEVWAVGALAKSLWGIHNHANLDYDRKLLAHPNSIVRNIMLVLCHILVFPNQHHEHHSRSQNSAKNMQNFIAIYDWLLWKTFVVSTTRPKIYGWRQKGAERDNAFYRFFHRDFK